MRLLAMLVARFGGALLLLPGIVLGHSSGEEKSATENSPQHEASRKFRDYLEADWDAAFAFTALVRKPIASA